MASYRYPTFYNGTSYSNNLKARFDNYEITSVILENKICQQNNNKILEDEMEKIVEELANIVEQNSLAFNQLDVEMGRVKTDVATLQSDVTSIKTDVATIKSDVATLKSDVTSIKTDVAVINEGLLHCATKANLGDIRIEIEKTIRAENKWFVERLIATLLAILVLFVSIMNYMKPQVPQPQQSYYVAPSDQAKPLTQKKLHHE